MRTPLICWMLSLAALGVGCALPTQAQNDLEANRALFAKSALPMYEFIWQETCLCADSGRSIQVTVSGNDIVSAVYVDDGQPVADAVRSHLRTIDGVFDLVADRLDASDDVLVSYDPVAHYPTSVSSLHTSASDQADLYVRAFGPVEPPDTGKPALRTKLAAERRLFVEPASYSFTQVVSCYCGPDSTRPIRVSVTGGVVTSAVYQDHKEPVAETIRASLATIPGWFDDIEQVLRDDSGWRSEGFTFTYDPALHYPTRVNTTSSKIADSGSDVRLSDFVTPADAP